MSTPDQPQTQEQKDRQKLKTATGAGMGHGLGITALFTAAAAFCMAADVPEIAGMTITAGIVLGGAAICLNNKLNGINDLKKDASAGTQERILKNYHRSLATSTAISFLLLSIGVNELINKEDNKPGAEDNATPAAKEITVSPNQQGLDKATYQYQPV